MAKKGLSASLGYNPYRDSEGKFDDGPTLLASRGRPKVSTSDQRKKIDEAKAKLRAKYAIEEKPNREKVLEGPHYMETPGFAINEQNLSDNDVRTILWRDKELFPGKTYGQYYETEKAKKGDIFMMSAAEYRQALVESGQYKDLESIESRMDWEKVDQYTEDMMSGDKFPPPQLVYDENGKTEQEGLHRLYAAERIGIESIPVVVSSDTRNQDIYPYNELSSKIVPQDELHDKHTSDAEITAESEQAPDPAANRTASNYEIKNAEDYKNANQDLYSKWASELPSPFSEPTQAQLEAEKNYRAEAAELKRKLLASQDLLVDDGFYSYNGEIVRADSSSMSYLSISDDRAGFNVVPVNGTSSDAITIYDKSDLLPASKEDAIKGLNDGDTLGGISRSDEKLLARYTYLTPENKTLREGGSTADTDRIKDIIDNTYSAKEQTVYRGVPASQFADEILALEVGETYSDKGFMSTSKSQNVASEFAKDNGVMLELEVPSGLGIGISLAYLSQKPDEEEFLLNAGLEFEVVSKNGNNIKLKLKGSVKAEPKAVQSNITDVIVERFSAFSLEAQTQDTLNLATLNKEYKKALADTRKELSSITGAAGGRWSAREDADFIKSVSLKNKPQQVSDDEFEAMKNSGDYITVYRNAGKPEYIEAFKNGENPVNPYHMYGTGVYFAVDKNFASGGEFAEGSEPEAIFEALIPKDKFSERPEGWERKDLSSDVAYLAKDGKGAQRELAQTAADQNLTSILSGKAGVHIPGNDRYSDDPFSSEQFVITNPAYMVVRGDA